MRQDTDRTQVWWIAKMLVRKWFRTLDVSVCVCSLDGESCECELCLGLDGGYGAGGKIGRCHYSATLPSLFLGHKRLLKNVGIKFTSQANKHCKKCESCPTQVTWKVKFKCQIYLSSLCPVCPGFPGFLVCSDDHDDHDEHDYIYNHNHDKQDD